MSRAKIIRGETKERDTTYSVVFIEMENAYFVLLSESSILLGERNVTLARLLAERLAKSLNKMVLVSVFVKTLDEKEVGRVFLRLLEKTLKKKGGLR